MLAVPLKVVGLLRVAVPLKVVGLLRVAVPLKVVALLLKLAVLLKVVALVEVVGSPLPARPLLWMVQAKTVGLLRQRRCRRNSLATTKRWPNSLRASWPGLRWPDRVWGLTL